MAVSEDVYTNQIPMVRYEPSSLHGEVLAPRGTVVVYLAAQGSEQLSSIRATARGGGRPRRCSRVSIVPTRTGTSCR